MKKIIIIVGPTASGKTTLSLDLAEKFCGEIINSDSVQMYKYLDIGSGKIKSSEMRAIPHHLFSVATPDQEFTAQQFSTMAECIINGMKCPAFIVGGNGLYIRALLYGLCEIPPINEDIKKGVSFDREKFGLSFLYNELQQVDHDSAQKISSSDTQRIIRAVSVFRQTKIPISHYQKQHSFKHIRYQPLFIGIRIDREILRSQIRERVYQMFDHGFIDEVRSILYMGYIRDLKPLQSIGYKEVVQYIFGEIDYQSAVENTITRTQQYAKRQMTWFQKQFDVTWFDPQNFERIQPLVSGFLS